MSAPTGPDPSRLRTALTVLIAAVTALVVILVGLMCAAVAYVSWQHPNAAAPVGAAVGLFAAIATAAAAIFSGIALLRRRS
ncbi:hypothetical protein QWM81_25035 [Streptomyces ficellus]|uniref:Uncharacterized protein n=1 Tax=Streptomyces ficellus TaxID=1977088 RepID=A0ABT7ZCM4_9ACTN|nr:hypothetical protein [Streptomyces ficellus]MDN3297247.1 hypothetical protein [Streptomyces ficellus]